MPSTIPDFYHETKTQEPIEVLKMVRNALDTPSWTSASRFIAIMRGNKSDFFNSYRSFLLFMVASSLVLLSLITVLRVKSLIRGIRWKWYRRRFIGTCGVSFNSSVSGSQLNAEKVHAYHEKRVISQNFLRLIPQSEFNFYKECSEFHIYRKRISSFIKASEISDSDKSVRLDHALDLLKQKSNSRWVLQMLSSLNGKTSESALHLSTKFNLIECSGLLISKYPGLLKCQDVDGRNVVHATINSSSVLMLQQLLSHPIDPIDLNALDYNGRTPLQRAILLNLITMAKLLLLKGAEPNLTTKSLFGAERSSSALHLAAATNNIEGIELLLRFNAYVNVQNDYKETPLIYAIKRDHPEAAQILISYGATVDISTALNEKPVTLAVRRSHQMLSLVSCALYTEKCSKQVPCRDSGQKRTKAESGLIGSKTASLTDLSSMLPPPPKISKNSSIVPAYQEASNFRSIQPEQQYELLESRVWIQPPRFQNTIANLASEPSLTLTYPQFYPVTQTAQEFNNYQSSMQSSSLGTFCGSQTVVTTGENANNQSNVIAFSSFNECAQEPFEYSCQAEISRDSNEHYDSNLSFLGHYLSPIVIPPDLNASIPPCSNDFSNPDHLNENPNYDSKWIDTNKEYSNYERINQPN
ncbi:hypothetical protein ACOME3_004613 [Neoechinorhynchus agilis]